MRTKGLAMSKVDQDVFASHERLKMELRLKGSSLAAIARQVGVSRTTVSLVGLRKIRVPRVERALAAAVGKSVEELFGDPNTTEDNS